MKTGFESLAETFEILDSCAGGKRALNETQLSNLRVAGWEVGDDGTEFSKSFLGELDAKEEFERITGLKMNHKPCPCCYQSFHLHKK